MFIHIGNDNVIRSRDVIAIVDYNLISSSTIMEEMMETAGKEKKLVGPTVDAKSVMITKEIIYYSTLSVSTLKKRASMISTISKLDDFSDELKEEAEEA
ncbi:extracellular matrix regulator RemB [Oceanobacillus manasiensis]|uniref:extracellular matrix regulator RemB n=1 Tax=Oceanobacillus manasiensis TaxID=586413 RepID=UPI0005A7803D|nr:extracellular matrix/biofilm biosynthesis regulator RemA family protein [Oceanobacillus manasiensis]